MALPVLAVVFTAFHGDASAQNIRAPAPPAGLLALTVRETAPAAPAVHETVEPAPVTRAVDPVTRLRMVLRPAPVLSPTAYLCEEARDAIVQGMLMPEGSMQRHRFADAEENAQQALELSPRSAEARYWLAAAKGMQATSVGFRDRLQLGREIYGLAQAILSADPNDARGHYLLGRLNMEIMKMSGLSRFIAGKLLGADLIRQASWEQAETHLAAAVQGEPRNALDRLSLARVYAATDRPADARQQLEILFDGTDPSPIKPLLEDEARALLRSMGPAH